MNTDYNILSYLIYKLLRVKATRDRPLLQKEIRDMLLDRYGMCPSRVTLSRILHQMADYDDGIKGLDGRKGIWVEDDTS